MNDPFARHGAMTGTLLIGILIGAFGVASWVWLAWGLSWVMGCR